MALLERFRGGPVTRVVEKAAPPQPVPLQQQAVRATSMASLVEGFRETFQGLANWFAPGQPVVPVAPEGEPRQTQLQVGYNLLYTPRAGATTSFAQLRFFADNYDVARLCINKRLEQVAGLNWDIISRRKGDVNASPAITAAKTFFERPDGENDWPVWLRMVLEDRLVCDAMTIYPRPTRKGAAKRTRVGDGWAYWAQPGEPGDLYALEPVAGDTIKPLVDFRGKRPDYPAPAYQQVLWGAPRWMGSARELLYRPQNRRTTGPYGFSEIEGILLVVNMALRKRIKDLAHFTDGNIPPALVSAPADWRPEDIRKWQEHWDALMAGDLARLNRMVFVPGTGGQSGRLGVYEFSPFLGDPAFDTWLLKLTCAAFHVTPAELGFTDDVNKASSFSQENVTYRDAINPLTRFVKGLMDHVLSFYLGCPELEFTWLYGEAEDRLRDAQIDQIYAGLSALKIDEIREKQGLTPLGLDLVLVQGVPTLVTELGQPKAAPSPMPGDERGEPAGGAVADRDQGGPSGGERSGATPAETGDGGDGNGSDVAGAVGCCAADLVKAAGRPVVLRPAGAYLARSAGIVYDAVDIDWHQTFADAERSPALGEPLPGALDAVRRFLALGLTVYFSCGGLGDPATGPALERRMRDWLRAHGIDPDAAAIRFRAKPRTLAVVDDRAVCPVGLPWAAIADEVERRLVAERRGDGGHAPGEPGTPDVHDDVVPIPGMVPVGDRAVAKSAISQAEAAYHAPGRPGEGVCQACAMFRAPDGCTLVAGRIDPAGTCRYWEATEKTIDPAIAKARRQAAKDDLRRWRDKAIKAVREGRPAPAFVSDHIPAALHRAIAANLDGLGAVSGVERPDQVRLTFARAIGLLDGVGR